ncbi:MAG: RES family NAD+ phosphorylase, partial [Gemmatimonadetes bacterium]|nr:RES family NAD+ phosphorylase [Gemmatimonadota bacterium]
PKTEKTNNTNQVIHATKPRIYRLATLPWNDQFLAELGLDELGEQELRALLVAAGYETSPEELCDTPFRPKRRLKRKTRYSDGSYPVFYSSLEPKTAEVEVEYWFRKGFAGRPKSQRSAYYQRFTCLFEGEEKDLRDKQSEWPDLVHESDYTFCNRIGAEAVRLELDGLVVPSARRERGSNLPVFKRPAIRDPESQDVVKITLDPRTGEITTASVSAENT